MILYVARHGQTQWNAENKVCGRTDLPLTDVGLAQAHHMAVQLQDKGIRRIISSPLQRALSMAKIVSDCCGTPVEVDSRLIEQNYGSYEGADRKDPGFLENKRHFAWKYPGGESMFELAHRVYSLIDDIRMRYPNETVLLVCHGGVCRTIRTYFVDMTNEEYFHYSPCNAQIERYELV